MVKVVMVARLFPSCPRNAVFSSSAVASASLAAVAAVSGDGGGGCLQYVPWSPWKCGWARWWCLGGAQRHPKLVGLEVERAQS